MDGLHATCWACGTALSLDPAEPIGRSESCERCAADIRSCRACVFYDPACHNACREPSAEPVLDKERGNFCGWYRFALGRSPGGDAPAESPADAARRKLEALFKR